MMPSRDSAVSPRRLARGLLRAAIAVVWVAVASRALAQVVPEAPDPPLTQTETEAELERLFRELFTVTMEIRQSRDPAVREQLEAHRAELLDEIRRLKPRQREVAPMIDRGQAETERLLQLLGDASEEIDWEEVNTLIEEGLRGLGLSMRELSERLEDLDIEFGPNQVRLGSRETGDRVEFTVPPELHEAVKEGIGAIASELEHVFDDSTTIEMGIMESLRRLEERSSEGDRSWTKIFTTREREPQRRVIADSVFKLSDDFEVEEDEIVRGDIFLVSGDVYVGGEVQGSVYTLLGDIWVDETGTLGKDAVSLTGSVEVDGTVHGHRFALGDMVPGIFSAGMGGMGGLAFLFHGSRVALQAVLLLVAFAVLGDRLTVMRSHSDRNLARSFLTGSVWLFISVGGFAVAGLALIFTVIGIPVVFVLALVMWAALLGSYFVACGALGERLLAAVGEDRQRALWVAGLVGMAIVELPTFLYAGIRPVEGMEGPALAMLGVDFAVKFIALAIGFGALIATRAGGREAPAIQQLPSGSEAPSGSGA